MIACMRLKLRGIRLEAATAIVVCAAAPTAKEEGNTGSAPVKIAYGSAADTSQMVAKGAAKFLSGSCTNCSAILNGIKNRIEISTR